MPYNQIAVAIVEDETVLRQELCFQLGHLGFKVEGFENANALYRRLAVSEFHVVVLDIGLPGEDGLTICSYLRTHDNRIGIVFVTAHAQRDDRLLGMRAGADAYLTKPVDIDELSLLLKRLAEHTLPDRAPVADRAPTPLDASVGGERQTGWRIELGGDFLIAPGGERLRLSSNEVRILRLLFEKPGAVAVTQEIALALGLLPDEYNKHRVEVIISRLRDKVLRETGSPLPLQTKRGIGYLFAP